MTVPGQESKELIYNDLVDVLRYLKGHLTSAREARKGIHHLTLNNESAISRVVSGIESSLSKERVTTLEDVRNRLGECKRCPLYSGRRTIVFGEGNPEAKLLFVGEGPGEDEDRLGRPFVGRAGQLLTNIIRAMGLQRESVYIANIVKCRPPGNRTPKPEEVSACTPFLISQIDAIRPRVICALGAVAARFFLQTEAPVSAIRGRFYSYRDIDLMVTYHPAYLLRNPAAKKHVWEDVQQIIPKIQ